MYSDWHLSYLWCRGAIFDRGRTKLSSDVVGTNALEGLLVSSVTSTQNISEYLSMQIAVFLSMKLQVHTQLNLHFSADIIFQGLHFVCLAMS